MGDDSFVPQEKESNMKTLLEEDIFTDKLVGKATIIRPGEGVRLSAGKGSCTFKVTSDLSGGKLGIYEIVVPPHTVGARLHYHRFMDEVFVVNKGVLTLDLHTETHHLTTGSTVYIPRFTPHGFSNTSDKEVEATIIFNPSEQREGYFKGLFTLLNAEQMDAGLFTKLCQKYDNPLVDPAFL